MCHEDSLLTLSLAVYSLGEMSVHSQGLIRSDGRKLPRVFNVAWGSWGFASSRFRSRVPEVVGEALLKGKADLRMGLYFFKGLVKKWIHFFDGVPESSTLCGVVFRLALYFDFCRMFCRRERGNMKVNQSECFSRKYGLVCQLIWSESTSCDLFKPLHLLITKFRGRGNNLEVHHSSSRL